MHPPLFLIGLTSLDYGRSSSVDLVWKQKSFHLVEAENTQSPIRYIENRTSTARFTGPSGPDGENLTAYQFPLLQWVVGASADTQPVVPWHEKFNPLSQNTTNHVLNLSAENIPAWHALNFKFTRLRSIGEQKFELRDEFSFPEPDPNDPSVTVQRSRDWSTFVRVDHIVESLLEENPPTPGGGGGGGVGPL